MYNTDGSFTSRSHQIYFTRSSHGGKPAASLDMEGVPFVFDSLTKSRRLEIANKIKQLESEQHTTSNRVRKQKQQIRDLAAALEKNGTRCVQLKEQIRKLKLEQAAE